MKHAKISKQLLFITDGLLGTLTDFMLLNLYAFTRLGGVKTMYDAQRMAEDAHRMLDEVNYQTIKKTLYHLTAKGLVGRPKKSSQLAIVITKLGKERIAAMIPVYRTDRPWDGHIYLVSYDIPKHANRHRDILREYIRKTGGALLQESLWINPYNPTLLLEEFASARSIPGTILVSKLGTDGAIGDETLPDFISRIYSLDTLAGRYKEFLETYASKKNVNRLKLNLDYFAILKDDPQLPFPLLPKDFPGQAAFSHYQTLMKK